MAMPDAQSLQDRHSKGTGTDEHVGSHASLPDVSIVTGAITHQGKVRSNNEDHYLVAKLAKSMQVRQSSLETPGETRFSDEDGYLLIVADGMGGAAAGERASAIAVEKVEEFSLNTLKWFLHLNKHDEGVLIAELRKGLELADQAVFEESEANARYYGMGTTLTMAYSVGEDLYLVHAGDSRAYLFRGGILEQITHDHTLVQLLVSGGVITPEDAKTHSRRNIVTNVIGGPTPGVHAEIHKVRVQDGDILILCTDGLTEPVSDEEISRTIGRSLDPEAAAKSLVDLALDHGGPDNVTVIVARYSVGEHRTHQSD